MKLFIAFLLTAALLAGIFVLYPSVTEQAHRLWTLQVERFATDGDLSPAERHDSLLVMSLNFRNSGDSALAWLALQEADSVRPDQPLTKGLIALYQLERGEPLAALRSWRQGAMLDTLDPNLGFLASLDTAALADIDRHMLEKMFVDTTINARLETALYHAQDNDVVASTERKLKVAGTVDSTFLIVSSLMGLVLLLSLLKIRKARRLARGRVEGDGVHQFTKPVGYMMLITSVLKLGQIVATIFNYFMLGTDISDFVSRYVFTPTNLLEIFTSNGLFALIFLAILGVEFFRRRMIARPS